MIFSPHSSLRGAFFATKQAVFKTRLLRSLRSLAMTSASIFLLLPLFAAEIKETSLSLPESLKDYEFVRVAIEQKVRGAAVETDSAYQLLDAKRQPLFEHQRTHPGHKGHEGKEDKQRLLVDLERLHGPGQEE